MFLSRFRDMFSERCSVPATSLAVEGDGRHCHVCQASVKCSKSVPILSEEAPANYNGLMNTDELIKAVMKWGREHKIDNPVMQALKVNEEVGEIATEITHNRLHGDDMIDALGDSLVTIIILADILGYDPRECLQEAYDVISKRKGETIDGCFVKEVDG